MQTRALLIAAAIGSGVAFAQQKPKPHVTVLTVCEVMGGLNRHADTAVAVVGRMERSVSIIDHYEFLSQDRCQRPLVRHGHRFPNRIGILTDWEEGMPKPPEDQPELDDRLLAAKLSLVRRSTALGSHEEPVFGTNGQVTTVVVPNEWAVVYGRIVKLPRLDEDCGAEGCGGDDVAVALIAQSSQVYTLRSNGAWLPVEQ